MDLLHGARGGQRSAWRDGGRRATTCFTSAGKKIGA
jgi:hypothetical protein